MPEPREFRHQPEFTGRAGEYFGIWIVNVLLSILTLGIYSAWAKVRTERYFYGNTRLAGSSFEYLADPVRILKGRLVAFAVVLALMLASQFMPVLYLLMALALFFCAPMLIVLALRFRARYSAWRGLRFRFAPTPGQAYGPFLGWPLLAGLTLSALYPLAKRRQHEFMVEGHRFGRQRFGFSGVAGDYYVVYLLALAMGVGLLVAVFVLAFAAIAAAGIAGAGGGGADGGESAGAAATLGMVLFMVAFYAGVFVIAVFARTRYLNLMWNSTRLGPLRFESTLRARDLMWLYFSNVAAVLGTLGLATPWAMVRLARYRAAHFAMHAEGGLDGFLAEAEGERAAAGAELVEALDLGVDIGL